MLTFVAKAHSTAMDTAMATATAASAALMKQEGIAGGRAQMGEGGWGGWGQEGVCRGWLQGEHCGAHM